MCKYIAGIIITPTMKGVLLLNFFVIRYEECSKISRSQSMSESKTKINDNQTITNDNVPMTIENKQQIYS